MLAIDRPRPDYKIIRLLLMCDGIDPNFKNETGSTSLPRTWRGCTALLRAVRMNDDDLVEVLVENSRVDVNKRDRHRYTPLAWAAWRGDETMRKAV